MGVTIYFLIKRDVRDELIRRALIFLVVATFLRIVMSTGAAVQKPDAYSSLENVPLQQIYFEVPFYAFVVVTIALMASWYQLYRHVSDFVKGIDHCSFERSKQYSFTGDINESLLSKSADEYDEKNPQQALSHKLQR
jgi:hypothetical protein